MGSFGQDAIGATPESVAAAGSSISDAVAIAGPITKVTGADGTKGAQLPSLSVGETIYVRAIGGQLKLYPHSSTGTLNGGSAGASVNVENGEMAVCSRFDSTDWVVGIAVAP